MKHSYTRWLAACLMGGYAFVMSSAQTVDTITFTHQSLKPDFHTEQTEDRITGTDQDGNPIVSAVTTTFSVYHDTLFTVVREHDVMRADSVYYETDTIRKKSGSQFQMYIGGGYGTLGYGLQGNGALASQGTVTGAPLGIVQLQYAYFFHDNWGVGIGATFSNTTSYAKLTGEGSWKGVQDSDGEVYDHTTIIHSWRERETIHTVGIPVSLQYQTHFGQKQVVGLYWDLGASANFNVYNRYNVLDGKIEDRAWYETTHLALDHIHEFGDREIAGAGKMDVRLIGVGVFADLGLLFRVSPNVDLSVGGFFNYTATDINTSTRSEIGFGNETFTFMQPYKSLYASTEAGASRPWQAGLKIGLRVGGEREKVKQEEKHEWIEIPIEYADTTTTIVTRKERVAQSAKVKEQSEKVKGQSGKVKEQSEREQVSAHGRSSSLLPKERNRRVEEVTTQRTGYGKHHAKRYKYHLIYFQLDKYSLNEEAQQHLDRIIAELLEHKEKHVVIDGHACELGTTDYNMTISRQRAYAVADYLEAHGVSRDRIVIRFFGNTMPTQQGEHALSKDRRVVVKVSQDN